MKFSKLSSFEIPKILNPKKVEFVSPFSVDFFSKLCPNFEKDFWELFYCFGNYAQDPRICKTATAKVLLDMGCEKMLNIRLMRLFSILTKNINTCKT